MRVEEIKPEPDTRSVFDDLKNAANGFSSTVINKMEGEKKLSISNGVHAISYPSDLDSDDSPHENRLIFRAVQPISATNAGLSGETLSKRSMQWLRNPNSENTIAAIQMYMPAMEEASTHNYSSSSSLLGEIASQFMLAGGGQKSMGDATSSSTVRGVTGLGQAFLNKSDIIKSGAAMAYGQIYGQRQVMSYQGTELRKQTFTFNLRPRNLFELKQIGEIIHLFRTLSAGSMSKNPITTGLESSLNAGIEAVSDKLGLESMGKIELTEYGTITVPPLWFIEERNKTPSKNRFTEKFFFGAAVITNIRVNKTPHDSWNTIAGTAGDPSEITLELTFNEVVPIYSEWWNQVRNRSVRN